MLKLNCKHENVKVIDRHFWFCNDCSTALATLCHECHGNGQHVIASKTLGKVEHIECNECGGTGVYWYVDDESETTR